MKNRNKHIWIFIGFITCCLLSGSITICKAQSPVLLVTYKTSGKAVVNTRLRIEQPTFNRFYVTNDKGMVTTLDSLSALHTIKITFLSEPFNNYLVELAFADTLRIALPLQLITDSSMATVSASAKHLTETARGSTLHLSKIKDAKFWKLADALEAIPGIMVDRVNGSISYLNKPVSLQVNGVRSATTAGFIRSGVRETPALDFETIELNLYDLRTEQPTLNFVRAKPVTEGTFGTLNISAGLMMNSASARIAHKTKKHLLEAAPYLGVVAIPKFSGFARVENFGNSSIRNATTESPVFATTRPGITLSDNYEWRSQNRLHTQISAQQWNGRPKTFREEDEIRSDTLFRQLRVENVLRNFGNQFQAQVFYTRTSKPGKGPAKRFDISINYEYRQSKNDQTQKVQSLGNPVEIPGFNRNRSSGMRGLFFSTSYELKHKKLGNFEAVAKYFRRTQLDDLVIDFSKLNGATDSAVWRTADIRYNYAALLGSWDKMLPKNLSIRVVLKGDYSADFVNNTDRTSYKFITFSPYLSLLKKLNKHTLRLEAKYAVKRPQLEYLAPFTDVEQTANVYARVIGNANLNPSQNLQANFYYAPTFKKASLNFITTYSRTTNAISAYSYIIDSLVVTTYRNLKSENEYTFTTSFRKTLGEKWTLSGSSALVLQQFSFLTENNQAFIMPNKHAFGVRISASAGYKIHENFQLTGGAGIRRTARFLSVEQWVFTSNAGAAYSKGRHQISLNLQNFHRPMNNIETITFGENFRQQSLSRNRFWDLSLSWNYRFGKLNRSAPPGKIIEKDDLQ